MSKKVYEAPEELQKFIDDLIRIDIKNNEVMPQYVEWAKNYDVTIKILNHQAPKEGAEIMAGLVKDKSGAVLLDVGAGTGMVGEELKKLGFQTMDALDGTKEMLDKARAKNVYRKLMLSMIGANRLDIPDNAYDCSTVIGCVYPGHVTANCLEELIRVVKPGGFIVIDYLRSKTSALGIGAKTWDDCLFDLIHAGKCILHARKSVENSFLDEEGCIDILKVM